MSDSNMPIDKKAPVPVVVVALENVLVDIPTSVLFMRFVSSYMLRRFKWRTWKKIKNLILNRLMDNISSRHLKFDLVRIGKKMPSQQFEVFAKHTRNHFNQEVLSMLDDYRRQGYEVLLATYAPGEYVPYIARELGITHYVCTPTLEEFREMYPHDPIDYRECFGLEKLLAIKEWLKTHNAEAKVLITDARFDYIIMRSVQGVEFKLVNTDPASVRRLKKAGIPFTIVQ